MVEILTNFVRHHLQNDFYHENNSNRMLLIFSVAKGFVLFETIFLLRSDNLLSKSVFVTKSACANLAAKFAAVNLLNSGVVYIYHAYDQ